MKASNPPNSVTLQHHSAPLRIRLTTTVSGRRLHGAVTVRVEGSLVNNMCPACGTIYNVAEKDIGRRLRCKKCNAGLKVTDLGLEPDSGSGPAPPESKSTPAAGDETADDTTPAGKRNKPARGFALDPLALLTPIGGVPGLLFCIGVFLVLFCTYMTVLGKASNERAAEAENKLKLERDIKIRKLLPKGKTDAAQLEGNDLTKYNEDRKKIEDEYVIPLKEANEDKQLTEIGNKRVKLYEGYGQLFGFILVAFSCLGFLLAQSALILRIVAAIILVAMVMGLFRLAVGASGGLGATIGIG